MKMILRADSLNDLADHFIRLSDVAKARTLFDALPRASIAALEAEAYAYAQAALVLRNTELNTLFSVSSTVIEEFRRQTIKEHEAARRPVSMPEPTALDKTAFREPDADHDFPTAYNPPAVPGRRIGQDPDALTVEQSRRNADGDPNPNRSF